MSMSIYTNKSITKREKRLQIKTNDEILPLDKFNI